MHSTPIAPLPLFSPPCPVPHFLPLLSPLAFLTECATRAPPERARGVGARGAFWARRSREDDQRAPFGRHEAHEGRGAHTRGAPPYEPARGPLHGLLRRSAPHGHCQQLLHAAVLPRTAGALRRPRAHLLPTVRAPRFRLEVFVLVLSYYLEGFVWGRGDANEH
eukprot:1178922-Prorocentrum_minimum.AAC.1